MNSFTATIIITIAMLTSAAALAQTSDYKKPVIDVDSGISKKDSVVRPAHPPKKDPIIFDGVALMTPEKDLQGNIEVADLSDFISNVETQLKKVFKTNIQPGIIILSITATPIKQEIKFSFQPNEKAPKKLLQDLVSAIGQLKQLKVKSNSVEFALQFTLIPNRK
jgi:hypothetical protein